MCSTIFYHIRWCTEKKLYSAKLCSILNFVTAFNYGRKVCIAFDSDVFCFWFLSLVSQQHSNDIQLQPKPNSIRIFPWINCTDAWFAQIDLSHGKVFDRLPFFICNYNFTIYIWPSWPVDTISNMLQPLPRSWNSHLKAICNTPLSNKDKSNIKNYNQCIGHLTLIYSPQTSKYKRFINYFGITTHCVWHFNFLFFIWMDWNLNHHNCSKNYSHQLSYNI